ncbi:MFS general substrate transporter [Dothidotthia symphoricarpi CBS 119687]|uniref:MFS general substrate transporter n=1 Tax=Dothidotthia symphoricarpi CBS 119687 TaxID=1392245 RepID=A0A6A6A406_9PLEO|nr:MFS general substrate transporter [Dothidotthia symphoricarpi CBS 119687]KAF2125647.1 MFS general substrate transporter [Dothidotthia symphoricarpi CBS 119687]
MTAGEAMELTQASPTSRHAHAYAMPPDELESAFPVDVRVHRRTLRKLDCVLLPFLALLFLFNSLDKSNIGNAESAHFTADIGLAKTDLNTAVALFFAFFVALQPLGAALGRRYGMVLWVPSCMLLWGVSTALHVWVRRKWELYTLRIVIGCLEAGFYPVTVSYLSLFYTRFEFGRRLSLFYGQAAVGGALGGLLSYLVFSHFKGDAGGDNGWKSWQVLFFLEGSLTMMIAVVGYFWLPHSVETAWFLMPDEREYASSRVLRDRALQSEPPTSTHDEDDHDHPSDESHGLLHPSQPPTPKDHASIDDRGITPHDMLSALLDPNIWHLLACNILSAVPVYAFSVFLPLVLAPLTQSPSPALTNLLTAPPHLCGAITLYLFAHHSDKHRTRLRPILHGLAITVTGLAAVVVLPTSWPVPRYLALNVLVSGNYIASPLTVAWIADNTPQPGKRALLLGINGWGNLAGVLSAMLFRPRFADKGYIVPFCVTLACVACAAVGYILFLRRLRKENRRRRALLRGWSEADVERERRAGKGPVAMSGGRGWAVGVARVVGGRGVREWVESAARAPREGDERVTFVYGL